MPFQTKARKCHHYATEGLLELGGKFTGKKKKNTQSLCGDCTPCPSKPKIENVTIGLQVDSSNSVTNLRVKNKKKHVVPLQGLNAMPFRAEARKCNHWALRGLPELGSKFNGTYMHMKCNFY